MTKLRVGLTGGIACGKSMVSRMFYDLGAFVVNTDKVAHELMQNHLDIRDRIVSEFGPGILDENQAIDRKKLAKVAFGEGHIQNLNAILHPQVIVGVTFWMDALPNSSVAIVEAALILEAKMEGMFDKLITVHCDSEVKLRRFASRQSMPLEQAQEEMARRCAFQVPDADKVAAADFVIDNSGFADETQKQVVQVWHQLQDILC